MVRTYSIAAGTSLVVVLLTLACPAQAGRGTITGRESQGWESGYYNVIVGEVHNVRHEPGEPAERHLVDLVPLATLGGTFDCSLYPKLPVIVYFGGMMNSIAEAPRDGATVIVVMQFLPGDEHHPKPGGFIFSDICTFMPDKCALAVIKGLDDPRVAEALKRLQDARANPKPDPNSKPPAHGGKRK